MIIGNGIDIIDINRIRKVIDKYGNQFKKDEIIINGGIKNTEEMKKHLSMVDGVMIGRAIYHSPYFLAEIEKEIIDLATKANTNKLAMKDLSGGTFSITNGGVYGSMMSTPIINPPQSAILGMHSIIERPIAVKNKVVIRPMMYTALSYDHRLIDGKQAVTFLVRLKEILEDPKVD